MLGFDREAFQRLVAQDDRVIALFVTGSHADGRADEHSDLDFLAIASESDVLEVAEQIPLLLNEIEPLVDVSVRPLGAATLVNLVTERCQRIDVVVMSPGAVVKVPRFGPARAVFDRAAVEVSLPEISPPFSVVHGEEWFDGLVKGVLRTVGLLPLIVSREEFIRGAQHVQLLKQDYLELLLFAEGDPPVTRPGAWAWSELNRRLSVERRERVAALPAAAMTSAEVVRGHLRVFEEFMSLARQVSQRCGFVWKHSAYQAAVTEYLNRSGFSG